MPVVFQLGLDCACMGRLVLNTHKANINSSNADFLCFTDLLPFVYIFMFLVVVVLILAITRLTSGNFPRPNVPKSVVPKIIGSLWFIGILLCITTH
jgi:hypothetical protein